MPVFVREQLGAPGLKLALVNEFLTGTFERGLHGMYLTKLRSTYCIHDD